MRSITSTTRRLAAHLLAATLTLGALTSCSDDEPTPDTPETPELENNDVTALPTEDIVETTVSAHTAVLATNLDEMSAYFLKRLDQSNITAQIADDTELLIIDDAAATQILKNDSLYQHFEDFYYRGGLVYAHKPSMIVAGLIARLYEGAYDGEPEVIIPLFDAWIFNIRGAQYCANDIHTSTPSRSDRGSDSGTDTDSQDKDPDNTGNTDTPPAPAPTPYLYGRYAENAARFVNSELAPESRRSSRVISRDGTKYAEPRPIPMHFQSGQYSLSKKFTDEAEHIKKGGTISASPILSINAEVTCAYSFDQNKDFYQISLSEVYPGQTLWNGSQKVKRSGLYYDKYGGYGLDYIDIYLSDLQTRDGVTLESLTSVAPFDPDRFYAGEDTQLDRAAAFIHSGR